MVDLLYETACLPFTADSDPAREPPTSRCSEWPHPLAGNIPGLSMRARAPLSRGVIGRGHWWWSIPLWCSHCARLAPLCPVIWHGCRANGSWPRKMSLHPFVTAPPGFILQKIKVPCVCKKAGTDACCAPGIVSWAHSQLCLDIEQARVLSFYSPHIDFENNCVHEISSAITIWKFGEVSTALCFPAAIPATHALSQKCSELIYVLNVIMIGDQVLPGGEKEHKKYKGNKIK